MKCDNKRCDVCRGELSYCGETTIDGPSLDCRLCQMDYKIRLLEDTLKSVLRTYEIQIGNENSLLLNNAIESTWIGTIGKVKSMIGDFK